MHDAERLPDVIKAGGTSWAFVVAQLGQSLYGQTALPSGGSSYINGTGALDHLHRLGTALDAVSIGIGAAIANDPQVPRAAGSNPARIVTLEAKGAEVLIIRRRGCRVSVPEPASSIYFDGGGSGISCEAIVHTVAELEVRRLLVEGGAYTVSRFVEEGQLDRLHVLLASVVFDCPPSDLRCFRIDRQARE